MAFEGLTDKLQNAFKKLSGKGKLSEADVKAAMREVRMALLEADVNYKVVKDFVATVTERAVGEDIVKSLTPGHPADARSPASTRAPSAMTTVEAPLAADSRARPESASARVSSGAPSTIERDDPTSRLSDGTSP